MKSRIPVIVLTYTLLQCVVLSYTRAQTNQGTKLESRSTGQGYALCGSCTLPKGISPQLWLVSGDEPGEAIILSGTIYDADGVTPDSGITLFVYQTDAGGYYHRPKEDVFHPRIFGWLRTDQSGHYEIHTIKPAPEILAADEPAHIHVHIFGKGMQEHFLHEFWFKGDPRIAIDQQQRLSKLGTFSPIVTLIKGNDGSTRGTRNICVRPVPHWRYEKD
jgi:protocatechuate 3,4-dioxygenase beta subunit